MSRSAGDTIRFDEVSKFYGEVLGVNRVSLTLGPGITGLVGPNGSGKTTLMNLATGLLAPTDGEVDVLGIPLDRPQELFRHLGYCTQYDAFPSGMTGYRFIESYLRVHGYGRAEADRLTWRALERVQLTDAARRRIAGYSKGMRQRVKLAQAISHDPRALVLDEPLNGLDPMARAEVIALFRELAEEGRLVIVSSHILHEVDMISDRVVLLASGYVVAEGDIDGVRTELEDRPLQVLLRCDRPSEVAARLFDFYRHLNEIVVERGVTVEAVTVADSDVRAVYQYLIGSDGEIL